MCKSFERLWRLSISLLLLSLAPGPIPHALAQGHPGVSPTGNDDAIRKAVSDHLRVQTRGLPGKGSFTIDGIQASSLPPCSSFDVSTTPGARTWGRSSVTVRCVAGASWSLLVPVRIHVISDYLISARPISAGQVITPADIVSQSGDLGELPAGILSEPTQALGMVARSSLPGGRPLRADMLRAPNVIQQGQTVKVVSRGNGFEVTNDGKAMANATAGQVVQVRLGNGQIVSGVAESGGTVEVNF